MAYKYFACPQRRVLGGCQRNKKAGRQGAKLEGAEKKEAAFVNKEEEEDGKSDKSQRVQRGHPGSKQGEEPESDDEDGSDLTSKKDEKTLDVSLMNMILSERKKSSFSPNGLLDSDKDGEGDDEEENSVPSGDLHYVFDKMIFTGGKVIVMFVSM